MTEIVSLAIVGAAVSVLVQFIKSTVGTSRTATIATVVALSLAGGAAYQILHTTSFWPAFLKILLIANAIYGFVISNFEA
jgi:hypothetical protein